MSTTMEYLGAMSFGNHRSVLQFDFKESLPAVGPNELLIQVAYVELNPVDLQKLNARPSQEVPNPPLIVGYGGSGTVVEVGSAIVNQRADWVDQRVAFLCDARKPGAYATHVVVHVLSVAKIPFEVSLEHAATVPLAGCTAYESLVKLQIQPSTPENCRKLLIVGGSGGVGSWATLLARARYPHLEIICTAGSEPSQNWCLRNGATRVVPHTSLAANLGGGHDGSVDYILCLSTPTKELTDDLSEVIRPYGHCCLVAPPKEPLSLGFFFFKAATISMETVFSSQRTDYQVIQPGQQIADILAHLADKTIPEAPLSDQVCGRSLNWKESALEEAGLLDQIATGHTRGKLVMKIQTSE